MICASIPRKSASRGWRRFWRRWSDGHEISQVSWVSPLRAPASADLLAVRPAAVWIAEGEHGN